jgi:hypothetical protein
MARFLPNLAGRSLPLLAVIALAAGCGYGTDPSDADVVALSPQVTPITASLEASASKTTYTVTVNNSPGDPTFTWTAPSCGTVQQNRTTGSTPVATLEWTHAGCAGASTTMIAVDVTSQQYTTSCEYRGTNSGTGAPCGSEYTPGRY